MVVQTTTFDAAGPDPDKLREVASFVAWCKGHGVRLILSYPPFARLPDLELPSAKAFFAALRRFYQGTGAIVQGKPEDYFYDPSWFQDTRKHLKLEYAERHTRERIRLLRPLFARASVKP